MTQSPDRTSLKRNLLLPPLRIRMHKLPEAHKAKKKKKKERQKKNRAPHGYADSCKTWSAHSARLGLGGLLRLKGRRAMEILPPMHVLCTLIMDTPTPFSLIKDRVNEAPAPFAAPSMALETP